MSKVPMHPYEPGQAESSTTTAIDKGLLVPVAACVYALIVSPLMIVSCSPTDRVCLLEPRLENKVFWPILAAITVILALRHRSRLSLPPHIICLFASLAFAGASVLWAFKPELAFIRFSQQAMIQISIVLPIMLAGQKADMLRSLFVCFALASILNVFFVFGRPPIDLKFATFGYPGYFSGKNYLGECAAIALLLSLYEMRHRGLRRALGVFVLLVACWLMFYSNSKTSLGLALVAPVLAGLTLTARKFTRLSVAVILLSIPISYFMLSSVIPSFNMNRLSYMLYGDSTFTGRTIIWDFTHLEIARRPLLGWGYQTFWLAGPDAPSILDAPGWVKNMPNSHSGYLDTMVELGYVGFALLITFVVATLHAIGRVVDRDPARAWLMLSLALFVIIYNFLETTWMRGYEFLWLVFVVVAAEAGRYWRPFSSTAGAYVSRPHGRRVPVPQQTR